MAEISDAVVLKQFAASNSEEAFTELVRRHIGLVHSVALRHTHQRVVNGSVLTFSTGRFSLFTFNGSVLTFYTFSRRNGGEAPEAGEWICGWVDVWETLVNGI